MIAAPTLGAMPRGLIWVGAPLVLLVGLAVGALLQLWPAALSAGYGQVSLACAVLAPALAARMRNPGRPASPGPAAVGLTWTASLLALTATSVGLPAAAPVLLALSLDRLDRAAHRPGHRAWLLLLLTVPLDAILDGAIGAEVRARTAMTSGELVAAFTSAGGWSEGADLMCGAHRLVVTPACSGARNLVGVLALAGGATAYLRLRPLRAVLLATFGLAAVTVANVVRIAGLCWLASEASFGHAATAHGWLGTATFAFAYALTVAAAVVLSRR